MNLNELTISEVAAKVYENVIHYDVAALHFADSFNMSFAAAKRLLNRQLTELELNEMTRRNGIDEKLQGRYDGKRYAQAGYFAGLYHGELKDAVYSFAAENRPSDNFGERQDYVESFLTAYLGYKRNGVRTMNGIRRNGQQSVIDVDHLIDAFGRGDRTSFKTIMNTLRRRIMANTPYRSIVQDELSRSWATLRDEFKKAHNKPHQNIDAYISQLQYHFNALRNIPESNGVNNGRVNMRNGHSLNESNKYYVLEKKLGTLRTLMATGNTRRIGKNLQQAVDIASSIVDSYTRNELLDELRIMTEYAQDGNDYGFDTVARRMISRIASSTRNGVTRRNSAELSIGEIDVVFVAPNEPVFELDESQVEHLEALIAEYAEENDDEILLTDDEYNHTGFNELDLDGYGNEEIHFERNGVSRGKGTLHNLKELAKQINSYGERGLELRLLDSYEQQLIKTYPSYFLNVNFGNVALSDLGLQQLKLRRRNSGQRNGVFGSKNNELTVTMFNGNNGFAKYYEQKNDRDIHISFTINRSGLVVVTDVSGGVNRVPQVVINKLQKYVKNHKRNGVVENGFDIASMFAAYATQNDLRASVKQARNGVVTLRQNGKTNRYQKEANETDEQFFNALCALALRNGATRSRRGKKKRQTRR